MPALNLTFSEEELEQLRAAASREGTSLKNYAHDVVVGAAANDRIGAIATSVAERSAELNERLR